MTNRIPSFKIKRMSLILSAMVGCALASHAQIVSLTSGNAVADINPGNQAGMFAWTVDGKNQLAQQWFWYGIGVGTPQFSLDTIGGLSVSQPNGYTATLSYHNPLLSAAVTYLLSGGLPGSGVAALNESIQLVNISGQSLGLRFYQYSDFDLMGTAGGDSLQLYRNLFGNFYEAYQTKGSAVMTETDVVPGASHAEASLFPDLLNRLNGGSQIVLADNLNMVGPGDTDWVFEWDVTLAPGESFQLSKNKLVQIPEPGTVGLLVFGLAGWALRKRPGTV